MTLQLTMNGSDDREKRDACAIRWVIKQPPRGRRGGPLCPRHPLLVQLQMGEEGLRDSHGR
jgi:hypothetical protein